MSLHPHFINICIVNIVSELDLDMKSVFLDLSFSTLLGSLLGHITFKLCTDIVYCNKCYACNMVCVYWAHQ